MRIIFNGYALLACTAMLGLALTGNTLAADTKKLVEACGDCHGKNGASTEKDIPIIGGYSAEFFKIRLTEYRNKETECPETKIRSGSKKGQKSDMCKITQDMSDADIKQIGKYFSEQKFVRAKQTANAALAKKGKEIHEENCEKCHSEGGTVASDDVGITAGQWIPYLIEAMKEFDSGKRPIAKKMKLKLEKLNQDEKDALIQYYGSFK
ncbi:MAG: hypothetical protein NTY60_09330 [Proteobacteria bacterium]|nr:hypothetical protein [Pseudomonadota bacterium]